MTDRLPLDHALAASADLAAIVNATDAAAAKLIAVWLPADPAWLATFVMGAIGMGLTLGQAFAAMMPTLLTGYMPEAQRRDIRHRAHCDGLGSLAR